MKKSYIKYNLTVNFFIYYAKILFGTGTYRNE